MKHRFLNLFPQFSERRLAFQQPPETSPEFKEDPVGHIVQLSENLDSGSAEERLALLDNVHEELKKLKEELRSDRKEGVRVTLRREQKEQNDPRVKEKLEQIARELDDQPSPSPNVPQPGETSEVSDIPEEKPAGKQTMMDQVKGFLKGSGMTMIGPLIKGFISLRRMLLDFFPPKDPEAAKKQLAGIEQLYGRFFGAAELQQLSNEYLQGKKPPLKVIEGNFDGSAYQRLKMTKFEGWITNRFPNATEEQKMQIREDEQQFKQFLQQELTSYIKTCQENASLPKADGESAGFEYVTTLMGIIEGQKPRKKEVLPVIPPQQQQ